MSWLYPKWLRECLTESDNVTRDFKRVIPVLSLVGFYGLAIWSVCINHSPFDALNFAQAVAVILGPSVIGVALDNFRKPPNGD